MAAVAETQQIFSKTDINKKNVCANVIVIYLVFLKHFPEALGEISYFHDREHYILKKGWIVATEFENYG